MDFGEALGAVPDVDLVLSEASRLAWSAFCLASAASCLPFAVFAKNSTAFDGLIVRTLKYLAFSQILFSTGCDLRFDRDDISKHCIFDVAPVVSTLCGELLT